jgi:fibronectin type 3 domain-containing protein
LNARFQFVKQLTRSSVFVKMPSLIRVLGAFLLLLVSPPAAEAAAKKVLFIGNSFTQRDGVDVPAAFRNAATGGGFELPVTDYNAPGGHTLYDHTTNTTTQAKISQGGWDYVVIQEQSTTSPLAAVDPSNRQWFFDDASTLYDQVKAASPAAIVVLYETWAWKESRIISENNADWGPDSATMQARISLAYHNLAQDLIASGRTDVEIAHVGDARDVNRTHQNLNMFSDDSHPNGAGVYLAGLVIYSTIFNADPLTNTHTGGLGSADALYVRQLARFSADIPAPAPPKHVGAVAGNTQVLLTWEVADKALTYTVKRATTSGGPYTPVAAGLTTLGHTDTGLTNDVTYYYLVTGVNASGESPPFWEISCTPRGTPPPPSGLVANTTGTQTALIWEASVGATSYTVQRSTDGTNWTSMATDITATTYLASGTSGQHYHFAVMANNAAGSSPRSASVTTDTVSNAPTLQKLTTSNTQVLLNWFGSSGATYAVKRSSSASGLFFTIASGLGTNSFTDTGLTAGAPYYYVVSATNPAGESPSSNIRKAGWGTGLLAEYYSTSDLTGPVTITRTDPNIYFYWPTSPDPSIPSDHFSSRWTGEFEAPSSETYTFEIFGYDETDLYIDGVLVATTGNSATKSLTMGHKYRVMVEQRLTIEGGGAAWLSWSSATMSSGAVPTSYLYPVPAGGTATASSNGGNESPAMAFDGLTSTKWYYGTVGGTGWLQYKFSSATAVTEYRITSANDVPQRDPAAWTFQGSNDGSVWTTLDTRTAQTFAARSQTNTYTIPNTTAYAYYRLNVTANAGGSAYGIQLSELTLIAAAVPAPTGVTAFPGNQQVALGWNASAGADSYQIKRATVSGGPYTTIATGLTGTAWVNTGLTNGTTYYYIVTPVRFGQAGTSSAQVSASLAATPAAPATPTGLLANPGSGQISLSWNASAGATSYTVKRSAVSGGPYTVLASDLTGTSLTNTGLGNGLAYFYVVSASNAGVGSSNSAQATAIATAYSALESWRLTHFGTAANTGNAADSADPDGDGWNNEQEFISGTDPNDRTSLLKITEWSPSGNDMHISFPTVLGKTYRLERTSTLLSDSWSTVHDNIAGTGGIIEIIDTGGASQTSGFFRIVVSS